MAAVAASRQIRQSWRHTGSRANRRSAVNTGFHGYFSCDLHRSVRIKDGRGIDQACGTGGMLSTGYNFIKRYNPSADVRLFGQEINPESYAMCLAEMLIKGQNAENICYQDTMKADRFKGTKMRFVLENPPFGTAWGGKDAAEGVEDAVNTEYLKGFDGRWGAGLPSSGDMQMLFLQSAIDKMDDNFGRAAIIENGSPLFAGGTASGESQIRRWMLEQDLRSVSKGGSAPFGTRLCGAKCSVLYALSALP